jgi:hypothetical protein
MSIKNELKGLSNWLNTTGCNNLISILALGISSLTFLFLILFPFLSKTDLVAGNAISINHDFDGTLGVTLPVSISNKQPGPKVIKNLALIIDNKNGMRTSLGYVCTLNTSQDMNYSSPLVVESKFTPITIGSNSNISKIIAFVITNKDYKNWVPEANKEISFWIIGWTLENTSKKPDIKYESKYIFSQAEVDRMKNMINENKKKSSPSMNKTNSNLRSIEWVSHDIPKIGPLSDEQFKEYTQ